MAVSGIDYSAIEVAIKQAFLNAFPDRLFDDAVQIGDLDTAFDALMSKTIEEYTDALIIDFSGGTSRPLRAFANIKWAWITSGVYMIRYHPDIETALRTVVSKIPTVFQEDPRLSGTCDLAYVTEIGDPAIGKLNDVSFYMIPFFIETLDRSVKL